MLVSCNFYLLFIVFTLSRYCYRVVSDINPNWHELWKQEKCSSLTPPMSKFYKTQWAWQGVKLIRLISIFHLQKSQLTNPKITRGVKVPCLTPIRVNQSDGFFLTLMSSIGCWIPWAKYMLLDWSLVNSSGIIYLFFKLWKWTFGHWM